MAILNDLLVNGISRFIGGVIMSATNVTSSTTYYPVLATGTSTSLFVDTNKSGLSFTKVDGTTGAEGTATLTLGNTTASGTAGNTTGQLKLLDYYGYAATIRPGESHSSAVVFYLPNWTGSAERLVSMPTPSTQVGGTSTPVYVDSKGHITVCTSVMSHTHNLGITTGTSSDTSQITLAHGTKYVLSAGGSTYCFTMPSGGGTGTVTGTGISGYLAKWGGASGQTSTELTVGPALGTSTTNFLREDGNWASPIDGLDATVSGLGTGKTITALSETNGVISASASNIAIAGSQVTSGNIAAARMPTGYMQEAYLAWGGQNYSGGNGPLDAALINTLGANRFAFIPAACITVEYSTDAGATWTDYGRSNGEKTGIFAPGIGTATYLGKHSSTGGSANDQLRITVDTYTTKQWVYSAIKKMCVYVSTNGASGMKWTCQVRTTANVLNNVDTWGDVFRDVDISGYSGINITQTDVVIGSNAPTSTSNTQYRQFRYIFTQTAAHSSGRSAYILYIMGFGGVGWNVPSYMAKVGSIYDYDRAQNVVFPARVKATELKGLGANYYGTCDTAAATAAKVVTCTDFVLTTGARISVKFTNGSTSTGTMTLNVNGTSAKNCGIYLYNNTWQNASNRCEKNEVLEFVYNGTYWVTLTPYALRNYGNYNSRLTSANISWANGGLQYFLATSSMTTGKTPIDSHILNMNWDQNTVYAAQLAVGVGSSTVATPGRIFSRGQLGTAATWSDWLEVPRLSGALTNNQIVVSDESTGNALLKGGPTIGTGTTKFLREDGTWQVPSGGGGTSGTFSLIDSGAQYGVSGNYYKNGKVVTIYGSFPTGSTAITSLPGLPFAPAASFEVMLPQYSMTSLTIVQCKLGFTANSTSVTTTGYVYGMSSSNASWINYSGRTALPFMVTYVTNE